MHTAYIASTTAFTPIGMDTAENWQNIIAGKSALRSITDTKLHPHTLYAGQFNSPQLAILQEWQNKANCSYFEAMCHEVIYQLLQQQKVAYKAADVLCIIATTKGNIDKIEHNDNLISESLSNIQKYWGFHHPITGISNACISGSLAIIMAQRYIEQGRYKHIIVVGADKLDRFIINGFQSFQAISKAWCRPFDASRDGINLGEAAAGIIVTADKCMVANENAAAIISGGGISNDANHLSGPSRTGEELGMAIKSAMQQANVCIEDIGCIAAHGTGTVFNDEMESKAIAYNQLHANPLYSLKSYFGHTLGASGVLETVISIKAMQAQQIMPNLNFNETNVSGKITIQTNWKTAVYKHFLKTASGFGGCNAAIVISLID